jgi:hypothetical protein
VSRFWKLLVLAAAVLAHVSLAAQSQATADQPSGIFLEEASGDFKPLTASMSMDVEVKGALKSGLTMGLAKPKTVVTHDGARAELVVTQEKPVFLFRFPPPMNRNDPFAMMTAMSEGGLPPMSTHPREFVLCLMTVEGDTRVLDSGNVTKAKYDTQSIRPREFRVRVTDRLASGEWAFFLADQRRGGGTPTQIWAFSYRPASENR